MLIILEGADGAGKSTLAAAIANALRREDPGSTISQWHRGPLSPTVHPLDEYEHPLLTYTPGERHHVICDRWHVGEAVYPEVFGRKTLFEPGVARHTDAFLAARGALLVHVNPPYEQNAQQLDERGDDLVTTNQLRDIRDRFQRYVSRTTLQAYTVTDPRDALNVTRILDFARELETRSYVRSRFTTYVGPSRPLYLLLGDVRHALRHVPLTQRASIPRAISLPAGPAFGPYSSTSGLYLLRHLPESLWQHGVALANACDTDDLASLVRVISDYGDHPLRICALGRNAWRAAQIAKLRDLAYVETLGCAPHPQFIRRFHHSYGYSYGVAVADALNFGKNLLSWRPSP
jgi:hypothetical protein